MAGSPVMAVLDTSEDIVDCPDTFRSDPYCRTALQSTRNRTIIVLQRISLNLEHLRVNSVTTPICFIHVEYVVIGVVTERGVPSQVKSAVMAMRVYLHGYAHARSKWRSVAQVVRQQKRS